MRVRHEGMSSNGRDKAPTRAKRAGERRGVGDAIAGYLPGDEYDEDDTNGDEDPDIETVTHDTPSLPFVAIDWETHASDADGKLGAEVIQTLVKRLPNSPGVYRMVNA